MRDAWYSRRASILPSGGGVVAVRVRARMAGRSAVLLRRVGSTAQLSALGLCKSGLMVIPARAL